MSGLVIGVWAGGQVAFESALKAYGGDDAERWDKVAAAVQTRSRRDCVARFKDIRSRLMEMKGGK